MKVLHIIFTSIFALFAFFQWNDPDSWLWMAIYGFSSLTVGITIAGIRRKWMIYMGLIGYTLGMIHLAPDLNNWIQSGAPSISGQMKAESEYIEKVREFFGLFLCLTLMIYLLFPLKIYKRL